MSKKKKSVELEENKILKGGGAGIVGRIVRIVLGFVLTIYLARWLEPHGFGLLNIGLAMVTTFLVFSNMGFSQSMLFYIPKYIGDGEKGKSRTILMFGLKIILVLSAVSSLILYFSSEFISVNIYHTAELTPLLQIFSVALFFNMLFFTFKMIFQSFRRLEYCMWVDIILGVTKFLSLLLIIVGLGVLGAFLGFTLSYLFVVLFCILLFVARIKIPKKSKPVDKRPFYRLALSFFALSLTGIFFGSLTNIIIGYLLDPISVGFFSISVTLSSILLIIPQGLGDSLQPFISEKSGNVSKIGETVTRIMKYSFLATIPATGGAIFLRESIIRFLYGASYLGSSGVLTLVLLANGVMGCLWIFVPLIYGTGRVRIELEGNVIKSVINVLLCFLLIPIMGVIGAGFAQLSMTFIGFLYTGTRIRKHVSFKIPVNSILKAVIATGIMLLIISPIQWVWGGWVKMIVLSSIGFIVYFGLLYLLRELDETDIKFIRAIINKVSLK